MEKIDVYRPRYEKTGLTLNRGDEIPWGCKSIVVFVCIFNSEGKLLIQKRTGKKSWGGKWDLSAGGAVKSGEHSEDAAVRELREEIGIGLEQKNLTKLMSFYYGKSIHEIYSTKMDVEISNLKLQKEEVDDVMWATEEQICGMIDRKEFVTVYKEFIALLFAMKTRTGLISY